MVPIIGLDDTHVYSSEEAEMNKPSILGGEGSFASKQPPRLVKAIASKLGLQDCECSESCYISCVLTRSHQTAKSSTGTWKCTTRNPRASVALTKSSSSQAEWTTSCAHGRPSRR